MAQITKEINNAVNTIIKALTEALSKATNEEQINQAEQATIDELARLRLNVNQETKKYLDAKITGVKQRGSNRREQLAKENKIQAQQTHSTSDPIEEDNVDDEKELSDQELVAQRLASTMRNVSSAASNVASSAWRLYYDNVWTFARNFVDKYVSSVSHKKSDTAQDVEEDDKVLKVDVRPPVLKVPYKNTDISVVHENLAQGAISHVTAGDNDPVSIESLSDHPKDFLNQIKPGQDEPVYLSYFGQASEYVVLNAQDITTVESVLVASDVVARGDEAITDLTKLARDVVDTAIMVAMRTSVQSYLQSLQKTTNSSNNELSKLAPYTEEQVKELLDELSHTGAIVVSSSNGDIYVSIQDLLKNPDLHLESLKQFHAGAQNVSFRLSSELPQLTDDGLSPGALVTAQPSTTLHGVKAGKRLSFADVLGVASNLMMIVFLLKNLDGSKTKMLSSSPENLVDSALTLKSESVDEHVNPTASTAHSQEVEEVIHKNPSLAKKVTKAKDTRAEETTALRQQPTHGRRTPPQINSPVPPPLIMTGTSREKVHSHKVFLVRQKPEQDPNEALQLAVKTAFEHYSAWLKTNKDPKNMQHARGKLGWFSTQQWRHGEFGEGNARKLNQFVIDHKTDFNAMVKEINHTLRQSNMNRHSFGSFLLDELNKSPVLQEHPITQGWSEIKKGSKQDDRSWWQKDQEGLYSKEDVKDCADSINQKIDGKQATHHPKN